MLKLRIKELAEAQKLNRSQLQLRSQLTLPYYSEEYSMERGVKSACAKQSTKERKEVWHGTATH